MLIDPPASSAATLPLPAPARQRHVSPESALDDALVARFSGGDESAFVEIIGRHQGKISTAIHRLLRNHADTEEITQDTFIRAHRALATFRGDSSLATWLHRIAINLARNRYWFYFRRRRQDSMSLDFTFTDSSGSFSDLIADGSHDPAREAVVGEFSLLVERCMKRLQVHQRQILLLRNAENRSYEEIATVIGTNIGTVKSRIARARERLRELLAETCPEFLPGASLSEWFLPARGGQGQLAIACA
ncbi:MAG: sigma-70 family RNA polymerase sigma factor [Opitutaceae bacterium]